MREHIVKMGQLGEAATQHDHIRIEDIDDVRKTASEAVRVARKRCLGVHVRAARSGGGFAGAAKQN